MLSLVDGRREESEDRKDGQEEQEIKVHRIIYELKDRLDGKIFLIEVKRIVSNQRASSTVLLLSVVINEDFWVITLPD